MIALRNDQLCASCHFANETHRIVTADKVMTVAIWGNNQQKKPTWSPPALSCPGNWSCAHWSDC